MPALRPSWHGHRALQISRLRKLTQSNTAGVYAASLAGAAQMQVYALEGELVPQPQPRQGLIHMVS